MTSTPLSSSSSEERCFFQVVLPPQQQDINNSSSSIVKLKLAPDCPLIHLFQHPKLQLPPNLNGYSFSYRNILKLDYEQTPQFYQMGTGEQNVNVVTVVNEKLQQVPQQAPQQQEPAFKTTRLQAANNNNNTRAVPLAPIPSTNNVSPPPTPITMTNNNSNNNNNNNMFSSPRQQQQQQELQQEQKKQMEIRHQREIELVKREAQNTIETLENRLRSQQQMISSLQLQNKKLTNEVQSLEEKVTLRNDKENARSSAENLQLTRDLGELQNAVARAEATSSANSKYKEKFEQTEKSYKALQEDFNRMQEVCRGYREQLEKRMTENSELRTDLDIVQRENEKLLNECALGSHYATKLASQNETARERKEANRALVIDMQNQQNVLAEQLAAARSALDREMNASAEYRTNLEMAVRDLRELRSAAAAAEGALQEEVAARRSYEVQLDRDQRNYAEEKQSLLKEIEELEFSLKMSERKVTKLEEQVRVATSKVISPSRRMMDENVNPQQQQQHHQSHHNLPLAVRKQQQIPSSSASSSSSSVVPMLSASNNNVPNLMNSSNSVKSGGGRSMVF